MKLTNSEGNLVEKSIVFDQVEYALDDHFLIKNLTVSLPLNEPLYVVGYNGAGKSLFLQLLIGFIRASHGRIDYSNQTWLNDSTQLSYSSQKVVLLNRSVFDNVNFVLKQANLKRDERKKRVLKALEFTNLLSKQHTNAQTLSGGEQQRLSLARALASRSELIVLDEPTASLDPSAIKRYESYLKSLSKTASIIMVSHDLAQIKRLAEKISGNICFLEDGQCVELTNALSFLAKPKTDAAKSFLKAHSFW